MAASADVSSAQSGSKGLVTLEKKHTKTTWKITAEDPDLYCDPSLAYSNKVSLSDDREVHSRFLLDLGECGMEFSLDITNKTDNPTTAENTKAEFLSLYRDLDIEEIRKICTLHVFKPHVSADIQHQFSKRTDDIQFDFYNKDKALVFVKIDVEDPHQVALEYAEMIVDEVLRGK